MRPSEMCPSEKHHGTKQSLQIRPDAYWLHNIRQPLRPTDERIYFLSSIYYLK